MYYYYSINMELFAPVPRRLVDISAIIASIEELGRISLVRGTPKCLRWSSLTFGIREIRLQKLCWKNLTLIKRLGDGEEETDFPSAEVETCLSKRMEVWPV